MRMIKECIRNVEGALRNTRGILDVGWISEQDAAALSSFEKDLQEKGLGGLGRYYNEGFFTVLSRQLICAVLNNNQFRHADQPCLSWMMGDVVIGEEITDKDHLESLEATGKIKLIGKNFAVYYDRIKTASGQPPVFICRALSFPEIEGIAYVGDVLSASPVGPADLYLKHKFGWDTKDSVLGTILIGFNCIDPDSVSKST
jgi:hypothetical protein